MSRRGAPNYSDVIDSINKSIELKPRDHNSYIVKEECLFELKRYKEALVAIEYAIRLKDDDLDLNAKARILVKLGREMESAEVIQALIEKEPEEALYYDTFGEILMWSKKFEKAIENYKKAIELLEKNNDIDSEEDFRYETYIKMGRCYIEIKQPETAREHLQKGKQLAEEKNQQFWFKKASKYLEHI